MYIRRFLYKNLKKITKIFTQKVQPLFGCTKHKVNIFVQWEKMLKASK